MSVVGRGSRADGGRVLSLAVMASALLFRFPQVWKVWRSKRVVGLNTLSFEVEAYGSLLCVLNGYRRGLPVELWGEHISNGSQSALLVAMIYLYHASVPPLATWRKWCQAVCFLSTCVLSMGGVLPSRLIFLLYDLQNAAVALSRLGQARTNYKRGGTGQLSLTTRAAMLCGNCVRIYTTVRNKAGVSILFGHGSSAFANGVLFAQCVWYYRDDLENVHSAGAVTPMVASRFRSGHRADSDT
jgi:mannose-P-dolichol utilization defect 1